MGLDRSPQRRVPFPGPGYNSSTRNTVTSTMSTIPDSVRVLHVDDEPDLADLVATFVEREDDRISVETATCADEG